MSRKFLFNDIRAFDPRDIRGLTLWLDYRNGVYTDTAMTTPATVGQTVKGWADRSGNAHHATEATNPPTLAADGLAFDGTNDVLRVARMTGQFGAGYSVFAAARLPDGQIANMSLLGAFDTNGYFFLRISSAGVMINRPQENSVTVSATIATLPNGETGKFIASATATPGGNLIGYFNGAAQTPASAAVLNWANIAGAVSETPFIGALNNTGTAQNFLSGNILSILIYNRPLTATELTQVHRYIGNQHGIAVP